MEVADQRRVAPECVELLTNRGYRCRRGRVSTAIRTSSEPASASALTCATVAATSDVSVLVIDCTTIGEPPPIGMPPTNAILDRRRVIAGRLNELVSKSDMTIFYHRRRVDGRGAGSCRYSSAEDHAATTTSGNLASANQQ